MPMVLILPVLRKIKHIDHIMHTCILFFFFFFFSRVQIGLWDGSGVSGTAQWARGPINVSFISIHLFTNLTIFFYLL